MRKITKVLTIGVLFIIVAGAISCRKNNNNENKIENIQGKITILTDKKQEQSLKKAAENFKKLHEKVDIAFKIDDNPQTVFEEDIKKKDSTVDIITMNDEYAQYYINKLPNAFVDVTQDISNYKDKFTNNEINNMTFKNKIYGFPWICYPKVILYRQDILSSQGVNVNDIKTWNDYLEIGKKVNTTTGKKILANVNDDDNDICLLLANELGISYFNENGKPNFDNKEWSRVLETIKNLYSQNIIYDSCSREDLIDKAQKGEIVSFIADPYYISYFINKVSNKKEKWGVMKLPSFEPGGNRDVSIGGCNLMISNLSKNKKISKEFIKFVSTDSSTSVENMKNQGAFPCNKDIYNLVDIDKNEEYFNCKVWNLTASVEKGSYSIIYNPYFFNAREEAKNIISVPNLQNKDSKLLLQSIQKDLEKKVINK